LKGASSDMALKVLLADDSPAIKKVVQLSLQDYGIVLKTVGSGKDVIDVAKSFQPDIALVDVLLPQKTGYEVAAELKKDAALSKIPIVMLWSSFMAFDEAKFKSSGAEDKLEKPFEVTGLRALINKYVPKTSTSPVSKHFEFPSLDFGPQQKAPPTPIPQAPPVVEVDQGTASKWSMASFEDVPDFASVTTTNMTPPFENIPAPTPPAQTDNMWTTDSEWVRKDLGKFAVPLPEDNMSAEDSSIQERFTQTNVNMKNFLLKPTEASDRKDEHSGDIFVTPIPNGPPSVKAEPAAETVTVTKEALAEEIKKQAHDIIERVVWKLVPEIATNIIREEIKRLLDDEK
jgi:CheY-like chemotaxis protein